MQILKACVDGTQIFFFNMKIFNCLMDRLQNSVFKPELFCYNNFDTE